MSGIRPADRQRHGGAGDPTRMVGIGILGLVLLAIAAAGSGAFRSDLDISTGVPGWLSSWVVALGIAGMAACLAISWAVLSTWLVPGIETLRQRRRRRAIVTAVHAFVFVAVLVLVLGRVEGDRATPSQEFGGRASPRAVVDSRPGDTPPGIDWGLVFLILTIIAVTMVIARVVLYRRPAPRESTESVLDVVGRASAISLAAVRAEPDPRRAVLLAYTSMEDNLFVAGLPRDPWETPYEFLDRTVVELGRPSDGARTLTALYERARFAHHPVTAAMRDAAIAALVELGVDLRAMA